jgi:hypothetical protein
VQKDSAEGIDPVGGERLEIALYGVDAFARDHAIEIRPPLAVHLNETRPDPPSVAVRVVGPAAELARSFEGEPREEAMDPGVPVEHEADRVDVAPARERLVVDIGYTHRDRTLAHRAGGLGGAGIERHRQYGDGHDRHKPTAHPARSTLLPQLDGSPLRGASWPRLNVMSGSAVP